MNNPSNATNKINHIEKFKGKFTDVEGGCTTSHTKTIQAIRNVDEFAIYVYLLSKPPSWNINVHELMLHFCIGRDRVYKAIKSLQMRRLIIREKIREQGQFTKFVYYVHLSPFPVNKEVAQPFPCLPYTVKPFPENQHTYKEEKLPYKEEKVEKDDISLTSNQKPKPKGKPPTQTDKQEYCHGVKGFEWVGAWV